MMRIFKLFILTLFLSSCGSGENSFRTGIRIGVDPLWYPIDFGKETSYVNGYTEDLLLEMAQYSGAQFELIQANWDNLLDGLKQGKYDAVITTLPPYEYNRAKYDFSENLLDLGPVLIVPLKAEKRDLTELQGELVGVITNDPSMLILAKHPSIIIRNYNSIPELLNALVKGEIEGALLNQIPAVNYVRDLYSTALEIVGKPMTDQGIHFIGPKGELKPLNKNLEALRKKKILAQLQKKWQLSY